MAGLAGASLDLDDAVGDLGHLELEQALDEPGMAPRDDDLGPFARLADLDDVGLEASAVVVALIRDLFGLGQQGLDFAQVEEGVAIVALLDDPGDDVALTPGVLLVLAIAFGFPDALEDHLARRWSRDTAEVLRSVVPFPRYVSFFVQLLAVDADLPGVRVDGHDGFLSSLRKALVGSHKRVGKRVEQRVDGNALLHGDLLERLQEVEIRRAHRVSAISLWALSSSSAAGDAFVAARRALRAVGEAVLANAAFQSKTVWALSMSP